MSRVRPNAAVDAAPARVTVVIPCFNYARYLPDAVGSVLAQDGVDLDVVIVDDASTDDSALIAESFVANDARVRLVRHVTNLGHVETSNEALGLATGEFVVKLDADDLLAPGSLARSAALLRSDPRVTFCYGHPEQFRGLPPTPVPVPVRSWTIWNGDDWIARILRRGHNVIMQPEVMLRRTAVEASGGYRPELRWAEDFNLWLRLAAAGAVGRVNGPTQGLYRLHDASFQRSAEDIELADLRARIAAVDLFLHEYRNGDGVIDMGRIAPLALSALTRDAERLAARATERPGGGGEAAVLFSELARNLDGRTGGAPARSLAAHQSALGRAYRALEARARWRIWRRYGL